eukprot:TCONS_00036500-protein
MAASNVNNTFCREHINKILCDKELPEYWGKDSKVTFRMLSEIFSYLDENRLSNSGSLVSILDVLCGKETLPIIKKPSNFIRKMKLFMRKNSNCLDNYVKDLYESDGKTSFYIGPLCSRFGLTSEKINPNDSNCLKNSFEGIVVNRNENAISNGLLLELKSFCLSHGFSWAKFHQCVSQLFPEAEVQFNYNSLDKFRNAIKLLISKRESLRLKKLENFLNEPFIFPYSNSKQQVDGKEKINETVEYRELDITIYTLLDKIEELELKVFNICEALREESRDKLQCLTEIKIEKVRKPP